MDTPPKYPLEQLILIKKNRFDQAVKILEEKKALLAQAYKKLYEVIAERDKVLQHKIDKLTQLRNALDEGTTSDKVQQMKTYLKIVEEKYVEKEKKVQEQQKQVDLAQKQVDAATQEVFQKKKDLEKIELHKVEWVKEARYEVEQKEASEQDEQGSQTYTTRKRKEQEREHRKDE